MAERSLSYQAYQALARRNRARTQDLSPLRPTGELVWIHLGQAQDLSAVLSIADRVCAQRPGTSVLVTLPPQELAMWVREPDSDHRFVRSAPDETPAAVKVFLDHWSPDVGLWVWGGLRPILVHETSQRGTSMHLVSADAQGFDGRRDRWLPDLAGFLVQKFSTATVRNVASANRLTQLGLDSAEIRIQPPLRASRQTLGYAISDFDELSTSLAGRPVWLAAQVQIGEVRPILDAHRHALRAVHRLLLVLEPADGVEPKAIRDEVAACDMAFGVWGDGDWPEPHTQVLLADIPGELGLWYRMASVSFLGSSLEAGHGGIDPMDAAALGTAILYGPNVRQYLQNYSRLANAGAARVINDAATLGKGLLQLIAPDQAANMAHAGWDVVSEGAQVVDSVINLVQDSLDERQTELT